MNAQTHPTRPEPIHPFACPLARTFTELRHGKLVDTAGHAAEQQWIEHFGDALDLLDELFQGNLGSYPSYSNHSSITIMPAPATQLPDVCYGLLDLEMADPTFTHVTPIVIQRGVTGYCRTDWLWRKELAKAALDNKNAALGLTPKMADQMMAWSMFGWPDAAHIQNDLEKLKAQQP